jgi:hypothetical protein
MTDLDEVIQFYHTFAAEFGGICCLFWQYKDHQSDSSRSGVSEVLPK